MPWSYLVKATAYLLSLDKSICIIIPLADGSMSRTVSEEATSHETNLLETDTTYRLSLVKLQANTANL